MRLRSERYIACSGERERKAGEDREVGVKLHTRKPRARGAMRGRSHAFNSLMGNC